MGSYSILYSIPLCVFVGRNVLTHLDLVIVLILVPFSKRKDGIVCRFYWHQVHPYTHTFMCTHRNNKHDEYCVDITFIAKC